MEVCIVNECLRPLKYKKLRLCQLHYNRYKRLGQTELPKRKLKSKQKCSLCEEIVGQKGARGMCSYHHKQWLAKK